MTTTDGAREASDEQAVYDQENWPFQADRAAFIGDDALALESYARGYVEEHGLSPDLEMPTPETLARWMHEGDCPEAEAAESEARLAKLYRERTHWHTLADSKSAVLLINVGGQSFDLTRWFFDTHLEDGRPALQVDLQPMADLFRKWAAPGERAGKHPMAPLMKAWFATRPRPASASEREHRRIIPAKLAMAPSSDRRAGKLFSMAAHVQDGPEGQLVMPGFQHDRQAPALPLALYDLGLGNREPKGRNPSAPMALRLMVTPILMTNQQDRHGNHPVSLEIPLRQLLAELYPGSRKPRPTEYWPLLMRAAEALNSPEARIPWYDPDLGRGGQRQVVIVGDIPRGPGALDDHVQMIVNLPPGSENGPQVSDNLAWWGWKSGPAYRALLNLAYWWHDIGVTTRPLGQRSDGQGQFWGPSQNPAHYPNMSDDQMVQIVFPTSARKKHRTLVSDAKKVFAELRKAGEISIIDGKPVPPLKTLPPTSE